MTSPYAPSANPDGSTNVPNDDGTTTRVPINRGSGGSSGSTIGNTPVTNQPGNLPASPPINANNSMLSMFQNLPDLIRAAVLNGGMNPIWLSNPLVRRMLSGLTGGAMVEALARQGTGQSTNTNDIIGSLGGQFGQPGGPGQGWWDRIASMQSNPMVQTAFGSNPEFASQIAQSLSMGNLGRQMFFAPYVENTMLPTYMAREPEMIESERTTLDLLRQIMGGDYDF